jgi:hypothetical protein
MLLEGITIGLPASSGGNDSDVVLFLNIEMSLVWRMQCLRLSWLNGRKEKGKKIKDI